MSISERVLRVIRALSAVISRVARSLSVVRGSDASRRGIESLFTISQDAECAMIAAGVI